MNETMQTVDWENLEERSVDINNKEISIEGVIAGAVVTSLGRSGATIFSLGTIGHPYSDPGKILVTYRKELSKENLMLLREIKEADGVITVQGIYKHNPREGYIGNIEATSIINGFE